MNAKRIARVATLALVVAGCAGMHKEQISQMRANGDPRADCYEACEPSAVMCMQDCDNKRPLAGSILQGSATTGGGGSNPSGSEGQGGASGQAAAPGIDQAAALQLLTEAAKVDEAKRRERRLASEASSPPPNTPPSSGRGSISTSTSKSAAPRSEMECAPCASGQRCVVYIAGSKQCAPGGKCWVVDKTHAECK